MSRRSDLMIDLSVEIAGLKLRNPLILASGILGLSASQLMRAYNAGAGGVITKSFTKEPREGYKTPIITGYKCGFLNAVGLANPGIKSLGKIINPLVNKGIPVIVSIAGSNVPEFVELASKACELGVKVVELNLSCPHVKNKGLELGTDPELVKLIVSSIKEEVNCSVLVKLGLTDKLLDVAKSSERAGADAIVLINTIRGMIIDVWSMKPVLSNKFGGLSGPAIHPIAVRTIYETYENVNIPIIGSGGVDDWISAVELILAGATAVEIGSAIAYKGLDVFKEITSGIEKYLVRKGFKSVKDIIGLAHK